MIGCLASWSLRSLAIHLAQQFKVPVYTIAEQLPDVLPSVSTTQEHMPSVISVRLLALHASGSGSTPDRSHPTLAHSSAVRSSCSSLRLFHSISFDSSAQVVWTSRSLGTLLRGLSALVAVAPKPSASMVASLSLRSGMLPAESLSFAYSSLRSVHWNRFALLSSRQTPKMSLWLVLWAYIASCPSGCCWLVFYT